MITNEDQKTNVKKLFFWVLAALTISLYLQLPVLSVSASQSAESKAAVSEQKSNSADSIDSINSIESIDSIEPAPSSNTEETVHNETNIKVIVSDPIEIVEPEPDYLCPNANRGGIADRKETDVLIHLINAEAYGLSFKAKVAVGQVVMNRWVGPYYGDDLLGIMTAPHQFTPIYDGSAYEKEIEPDSVKAAYAVLNGTGVDELTEDTYYFVNPDFTEDKTIERTMAFVCEIEGIHFFKPQEK